MKKKSLSVLLPNYNHGKYIARAIEAVAAQSRPPDEYIIVDDGSTDNSVEIVESYVKKYPYIRFIKNSYNTGVMAAFNRALSMATGDYIYGSASDDYVLQGFFEQALNTAKRYPQAGLIFGKIRYVDQENKEIGIVEVSQWKQALYAPPDVFLNEYIKKQGKTACMSASTIYKRSDLEEIGGFREELLSRCDLFAIHAIGLKNGACYIPECFVNYTYNPNCVSETDRYNPKKMLDVIARMTWLMRYPEFRDRFPESHVRQWEGYYRREVINENSSKAINQLNQTQLAFRYGLSQLGNRRIDKLITFILMKYLGLGRRILSIHLKQVLNNYQGDISCYLNKG